MKTTLESKYKSIKKRRLKESLDKRVLTGGSDQVELV